MEMPAEQFDSVAYEVESHLRELRRLVAETVILSDAQNSALKSLNESLYAIHTQSADLRHSLLTGQDPVPLSTKPDHDQISTLSADASKEWVTMEERLEQRLGASNPKAAQLARERIEFLTDDDLPPGLTREVLGIQSPPQGTGDLPESDPGGAPVLAGPVAPRPSLQGGAARTFAEAEEPPRNP